MSLFGRLRLDIKREHVEIKQQQHQIEKKQQAGADEDNHVQGSRASKQPSDRDVTAFPKSA
jgi:hypothetical protein